MAEIQNNYEVRLEEKISKKSGNPYYCLVITFPNGYEKIVYLERAELYMLG